MQESLPRPAGDEGVYVFAYGSLLHRPGELVYLLSTIQGNAPAC